MFKSITINYTKEAHTLGNIVECLLFYDNVNLIISKIEDLPSLWSKIGTDGLIRFLQYGLHLFIPTHVFAFGDFLKKYENIHLVTLNNVEMLYRVCEKSVKEFYASDTLTEEQKQLVNKYYDISESFSYSDDVRTSVINDICHRFVHKDIIQFQLKEINSDISMFDPKYKYEFKTVADGFVFDTNLLNGELEESAKKNGYPDMCFKHSSLVLRMAEIYGTMEFAAKMDSSLSVSPAESIIVSCKQNDILTKYRTEDNEIKNFEKCLLSSFPNVSDVVDVGCKSIDDICRLLDCAQEFKEWKNSLPNEKDFLTEYQKALKDNISWLQRTPGKITRFIITAALGGIPLVGSVLGPLSSGLDTFLLDKLINGGWKPAQFVNGELKRFVNLDEKS